MFQSATLKLTAWYLAILIAISLVFSVIIYNITSNELASRLGLLPESKDTSIGITQNDTFNTFRQLQIREAEGRLLFALFVANMGIWIAGGFGSYYLARRSLKPIEEAHEAQSRFSSDASHELRTPLASMKTELEVALRDPRLSKDEMRELLESNLEEVDKLSKLSQTLLQLSRLDHENISRERVFLSNVAKSVIKLYDKSQKRITVKGNRTYTVVANKSSIEELFSILVDNALKYSPPDSNVQIKLIRQRTMTGFEITNTGDGIPSEILPHIFDRFYRADTSCTGGEKRGHGLGLSLAKRIVEINNGELSVTSAPQHDTTFRVLLPNFSFQKRLNNKQT